MAMADGRSPADCHVWLGIKKGLMLFVVFALVFHGLGEKRGYQHGIALFVLIEAGAREIFFGVLFLNMLGLFAERDWIRRALPLSGVLYLLAFSSRMGWLPGWNLN